MWRNSGQNCCNFWLVRFFWKYVTVFGVKLERVLGLRKLVAKLVTAGRPSGSIYTDLLTGAGSSGNKGSMKASVERSRGNCGFL